jgi:glycosyltransferase involved in cell wall biosynthesis
MKLTGISLISSGESLAYPREKCVINLCEQCDEVILNVDRKSKDKTCQKARELQKEYPNLDLVFSSWDFSNTGDGSELAKQANVALEAATGDWIIYLQADEFLLDEDIPPLKKIISELDPTYTQIELWRTYFYKNLQTRLPKEELYLGRIFKRNTHEVGGDGMFLVRKSGRVYRTDYKIYHFSRIGTEQEITKRVRQLDTMFHEKEIVASFEPFVYNNTEVENYLGNHPKGIKEFYNEI